MLIDHLKKQARNLQAVLTRRDGRRAQLAECQQIVAEMHGYPDWHAAQQKGSAAPAPTSLPPTDATGVLVIETVHAPPAETEKLLTVTIPADRLSDAQQALHRYFATGSCEKERDESKSSLAGGIAAARRLLEIAMSDTGQARKVADFLLAWYNAESNGGWDPFLIGSVDDRIGCDMIAVLEMVQQHRVYPNSSPVGLRREIGEVWALWRGVPTQSSR